MRTRIIGSALACALLASTAFVLGAAEWSGSPGDKGARRPTTWAEDEFEAVVAGGEPERAEEPKPQLSQQRVKPSRPDNYILEAGICVFIVLYGVNLWIGRRKNEQIALAWARAFCGSNSVLEHNFALLGPGDSDDGEMLMKQSQHNFQLYASGRRYCSSLLATLDLAARQDLLSQGLYLVEPRDDILELEVAMNDGNMPPMCLLVGQPKLARALHKSRRDLAAFAKVVEVGRDRVKDWPGARLMVLSESAALFYDLFTEPVLELAFLGQAFQSSTAKYLRYLLLTSDNDGPKKKVLRFSFKLPPVEQMHELARLMDLAMKLIDLVAHYNGAMPAKQREKAQEARDQRKADKEARKQQDEELQKKKQERRDAELERVKKLGPEARAKYEERQKRIEQQRQARKRTIKV